MCTLRLLLLACAFALGACKSERPTEFVNVAFTISVDTEDYHTWKFDDAACEDFDLDWLDHAALRVKMLESIEAVLAELGHDRVIDGEADFLVSYEFWVEPGTTRATAAANAKGSIVIRDAATGRFVWRATKKAQLIKQPELNGSGDNVREFVATLLRYTTKL